jgi:acyl-CoA dehydrogenase
MRLTLDPADEAFRDEVRAFLREALPPEMAARAKRGFHTDPDDRRAWTKILAAKGWAGPTWPVEHGGPGWSDWRVMIFEEECYLAGAPIVDDAGFRLAAPVIWTFGTPEQQRRWLPPILSGDTFWGQGFSEPDAGSDLAALSTRAVREGEEYVINGRKIWTTDVHHADLIFALVKTAPEAKQNGISFVVIDAHAPGVTIRPIIDIGEGHSLNAVFLDDVRIPADNLIGEENKGWSYAKFLLDNERAFSAEIPRNKRSLARAVQIARDTGVLEDPDFAARLAECEADLNALEYLTLRALASKKSGTALPVGSMLKIRGSELNQKLGTLQVEALGPYGSVVYPQEPGNEPPPGPDYAVGVLAEFMYRRAVTIYGGSNEIQRTIIAKSFLGL